MKRLIAFFSIVIVSIFVAISAGAAFNIDPVIPGVTAFIGSFIPLPTGSVYSLMFTAPGGVATPFAFQLKGLPQFLTWNDVVPLTSLRVETQEDGVIHDWVALSIAAMNGYMVLGAQAANIVTMRLANGFLKGKNVTISGVTSAAGAIGFYGASDCLGTAAFKTSNANILALEPQIFSDFTAVFVPAMAAVTDTCEVLYNNGHRQLYNINDLAAISSMFQDVPAIMVNNVNANIKSATFQCAAAHPAYVLSVNVKH
jgi:hypothetical protein